MLGGNYICYRIHCFYKKRYPKWWRDSEERAFGLMYGVYALYIVFFALFITSLICKIFFKTDDNFYTVYGWILVIGGVVGIVFCKKKYTKERMAILEKKYKKDWRNKVIANWMLIPIFPLYFATHLVIIIFIFKLIGG